jgi:glycosyltransferase involved in cell wall biosynthesis
MLQEAVGSILASDYKDSEIHVIDDGSGFDVDSLLSSTFPDKRISVHNHEPVSARERVGRVVDNMNEVIESIDPNDIIFYLCDDDLMDHGWITAAMEKFVAFPDIHMVVGQLWYFEDIRSPWQDRPETLKGMKWAIGVAAHRASCLSKENIRWVKNRWGHSFDYNFHDAMLLAHPKFMFIDKPSIYKRLHPKMLGNLIGDTLDIDEMDSERE